MADGKVKIDIEADSGGFEEELDDVSKKAKDGADGLDDLGDSAKDAGKGMDALDVAAGSFISGALQGLISGAMDAAGSLLELAASTREYREDMAKLETAFTTQGHTADAAAQAYEDFYAILGESDRSVEAVNHLAELTENEKELAKWSDIAAGVTAKFGDSLPIEGLTEAANETAKVGQVTGPLADALNWAGISEDEFNKKLEKCNSEQERATLITETLNEKYADAAEEYNKLTASTQEANRATANMEQAQADIGAALEPVTTAWTNLKANALEALLPVVETVVTKIQDLTAWLKENETAAAIITAVILGLAAGFGVLAIALGISSLINTVRTAITALNLAMLANPALWVVAVLAGLVAAFIYLWNNVEGFREFWINAWEWIKSSASAAKEKITQLFTNIGKWFSDKFAQVKKAGKDAMDNVKKWFTDAYTGITNIWDAISGYFSDLKDDILGAFDGIVDDFFDVGDNIITGIWKGLKAGWDWLVGKVKSLAGDLFGAAQEELDSHSPSRKFAWLGATAPQGLAVGWEDEMPKVERQVQSDLNGLTARIRATVGAESARAGQSMGRQESGFSDLARAVGVQTAGINSLSAEYRRGAANMRPVVLQLNGRELGRAVVDVSSAEETRVGMKLAYGGA